MNGGGGGISDFCQLVQDRQNDYYRDIISRLKSHELDFLASDSLVILKHIEVPEEQRRQGLAGRALKNLLTIHPHLLAAVPLSNLPALKLFRSLHTYFWPAFITWRMGNPEVIFFSDRPRLAEIELDLQDEFARSLSFLAQSSLATQPVRVISILFDILSRRNVIGRRQIHDLSKIVDIGDWERLGTYVSPGCHPSLVGDLWPIISHLILCGDITKEHNVPIEIPPFQRAAFIGIGLQHKSFTAVGREYDIPGEQIKIQFKLGLAKVKKYAEIVQLGTIIDADPFELLDAAAAAAASD